MPLFAYQWEGDRKSGTYFTPIRAADQGHALATIENASGDKNFDGWIWEVSERTKFDKPVSGMKCWRSKNGPDGKVQILEEVTYQ